MTRKVRTFNLAGKEALSYKCGLFYISLVNIIPFKVLLYCFRIFFQFSTNCKPYYFTSIYRRFRYWTKNTFDPSGDLLVFTTAYQPQGYEGCDVNGLSTLYSKENRNFNSTGNQKLTPFKVLREKQRQEMVRKSRRQRFSICNLKCLLNII